MKIEYSIDEATLQLEKSRAWNTLSLTEFLICFESQIELSDTTKKSVMVLKEVPLLGFSADIVDGIAKVSTGGMAEFTSFYGTYNMKIEAGAETSVKITDTFSNQVISAYLPEIKLAICDFVDKSNRDVKDKISKLIENPKILNFLSELRNRACVHRRTPIAGSTITTTKTA